MTEHFKMLKEKFLEADFDFDDKIIDNFLTYYEMLIEKNKVMNLTAITEFDDVVVKHFIDSLLIIKFIDFNNITDIIDIGTGAGFPGLPIKIIYPELRVVLMDSLNKRLKFLNEVIDKLNLDNIKLVHSRAEDLARLSEYREKFDLVVSRAVANLSTLSEYCIPFVKVGGCFVSYKSDNINDELDQSMPAINLLGGNLREVRKVHLNNEIDRSFIIIDKKKNTLKKFPRKAGTPSSEPLK